MGRKVSDRFTVPICRLHHRELHRGGNERVWWQSQGIDPLVVAGILWTRTHTFAEAEATVGYNDDRPPKINGRLSNGADTAFRHISQDDETKPIGDPEAE